VPIDPADACEVVERDFVAAWSLVSEGVAELHDAYGLRWFHTGAPDQYLNMVLTTTLPDDDAGDRVAALVDELVARGAPFIWWLLPSSRPENLGELLTAQGLVPDEAWPGMALHIPELVEPPRIERLEIRRVTDVVGYDAYEAVYGPFLSSSAAFTEALRTAFTRVGFAEDAPEVHFVGYLDGGPVASASLITAGGAAGIYNVATIPWARRQGIGAQITAHAVAFGGERGLEVATLQASQMGRPVYERLGFRFACDLVPYRFPG
jgi:ribosomal protein S18 acetylase RimI-like enzyme